jgi:acetyltransferase EpsM
MKVAIFGSGGLAKETIGYLHGDPRYEIAAVVSTEQFNNLDYGTKFEVFSHVPHGIDAYIMAVADPAIKRKLVAENGNKWITYAHPSAYISPYAKIGWGCVFAPQALVCGDPVIEDFVFFNTNATVGHDSIIRKYVTLFPNSEVCGGCDIGEDVVFGIGAYALPNVKVAAGAKVSAGAIVRKSVLEAVTVYGDPAAERQKRSFA